MKNQLMFSSIYATIKEKGGIFMTWEWILIPVIAGGLWFLHSNGYMYSQSKSALSFFGDGRGQRNCMGFSFTRCTGWVSRVLKVKEAGIYRFDLDASLSAGTVQFQVLDRNKLPVLTLNPDNTRGRIPLESKQRYFVKMQFMHTSGGCAATWEKE